jgi:hypothetical protein
MEQRRINQHKKQNVEVSCVSYYGGVLLMKPGLVQSRSQTWNITDYSKACL